ncbi:MAG: hypothetical protein K0U84_08755 [Actinomycetia bacterium]|nr:hypothetical protein [Actinomycetes bacterium]
MDAMRYNHAQIADHVSSQQALVAHFRGLRDEALAVLAQTADFWTNHGANAYAEAQRSIVQAYDQVFLIIEKHAGAIGRASGNADAGDLASAARFGGI